jgi:uncharacterized protein with von Willebrand factor type A (vWA) domain
VAEEAAAGEALARWLVRFGRVLREGGLEVGPGRICDAANGLDTVDIGSREDVYWTLRHTLVSRHEDLEPFDRAFEAWFGAQAAPELRLVEQEPVSVEVTASRGHETAEATGDPDGLVGGFSPEEILREKEFTELDERELALVHALIAELAARRPQRQSRRVRRVPNGTILDMRRLVRASLATGGDPAKRAFASRVRQPRRLIALCDVSGSMEPYSRALLMFVHSLLRSGRGVEAFAFGTRLTRLTDELSGRDPQRAVDEASRRVVDWSGGTKIGASLKAFNDTWGHRALARGAVVLIASDGWERDDNATVAREMARLAQRAYAVVWINPLKGHPDYQPLAGGMSAALPYVDRFLPGHNLASLEHLAKLLAGIERRHVA